MKKTHLLSALVVTVLIAAVGPAFAQQPLAAGQSSQTWMDRPEMTGDWFRARPILSDHGLDVFGAYSAEVWGNTTGGLKTGTVYTGLLNFGANLDLDKAVGWEGATISTNWLWISGRDASADLVGNFLTISNIAGFATLRLLELWFEQKLLDDRLALRIGQLAADSEFTISDYGALFLNATFGWPPFASLNMPEGGPGYPMGTLGAHVSLEPVDWLKIQSAVFQGDVFAQNVNRHGFRWRLNAETGYTFMNEVRVHWNHRDDESGLPGQLKAGVWAQSGRYANPLADSTSSGNYGFYAILDQLLYREPSPSTPGDGKSAIDPKSAKSLKTPAAVEKNDEGLGFFGRVAFTPADRNFNNFYFDTGLTYKGLLPTRNNDTVGIAFAYAQISNGARSSLAADGANPIGAEMVLEFTYQAQISPALSIQPDLQYIINPGCNSNLGNALVIGARASVTF